MPSDIDIAQNARMQRIIPLIEGRLGIPEEHLEPYGHYKAKLSLDYIDTLNDRPNGKLVLVTNDETIEIRNGEHFVSLPPGTIS